MQGPLTQITSAAKRRGVPLEEYLEMLEERFEDTYPHSHVYTLHFHSKAAQKLVMGWFHETLEEEELPVYAYSFENGAQGGALHLRLGIPLHGSVAAQDLDEAFEEWCEENEDSFPEDEDGEVVRAPVAKAGQRASSERAVNNGEAGQRQERNDVHHRGW
jgi:hypothetical protein